MIDFKSSTSQQTQVYINFRSICFFSCQMSCRQPWSQLEDQILTTLVKKYGVGNWVLISQKMEARVQANYRSGKQCRQRWHNQLDPSVSKKSWTFQEQKQLFQAHKKYGNKWSDIAEQLKGRTDSDVKNNFYSIIRKSLRRLSKLMGQKNSTQKIRSVKPSVLSKLLQNNKDEKSKETSQALFKFILQRQKLNINNIEKRNKQILECLVQKIITLNQEKEQPVKSFFNLQENQRPNSKRVSKVRESQKNLRFSMKMVCESQMIKKKERLIKKKSVKTKKINKKVSIKSKKRSSKIQEVQNQNNKLGQNGLNGFEIELPVSLKNTFRVDSVLNESPSNGFKPFQDGFGPRNSLVKRNSVSRESMTSDRGFFSQILITDTPTRVRSSLSVQNKRMLSNTQNFAGFCVTPQLPTPGYGGDLFPGFHFGPGQLTMQGLNSEVDGLRQQIRRNNRNN